MKIWKLAFLGAILSISTHVWSETTIPWTKEGCESVQGTWITAHAPTDAGCDANHCNGINFCMGPKDTNLWSAIIWCKSIGRELTDLETACPNGLASSYTCENLKEKVSICWTKTPAPILRNNSGATCPSGCNYRVTSGGINSEYRNQMSFYSSKPLCK